MKTPAANRKRGVHSSKRRGTWANLREYLWPSMGLRAFGRWMYLKLLRQSNQPHYVAMGAALGVMVSFFPVLGTHTALIFVLTTLLRGSFVAGMLGTMLANPWTIGPMWAGSFELGRSVLHITGKTGLSDLHALSFTQLLGQLPHMLESVIVPTMLGGAILGGPLAVATYAVVYWRLRRRRAKQQA